MNFINEVNIINNKNRYSFIANVDGFGLKNTHQYYYIPLVKLTNIRIDQQLIVNECYVNYSNQFAPFGKLPKNTQITFDATFEQIDQQHIKLTYLKKLKVINFKNDAEIIHLPKLPNDKLTMIGIILTENRPYYQRLGFEPSNFDRQCIQQAKSYYEKLERN